MTMTDIPSRDALIEATAAALYRTSPEMDQPVDLDGRPTGHAFIVPWVTVCEFHAPLADKVRDDARAILTAILPHVLAGPREALGDIGIYGCGMLNQPAALNGPEEDWLRKRIAEYERRARAALAQINTLIGESKGTDTDTKGER